MIGGHLGGHERIATDFAGCELLAHLGFLVIGQPGGHRPRGDEDRRDMAEGRRRHDQAGHDLVADAHVEGRVEGVVAQRDRRRHCDHVTREERQVHPRLALRDAVAHRGHAARDLRRGADFAQRGFDRLREGLERLVRREHVVIGRHDAHVGGAIACQRVLVLAHGRIGVGLIAAAEMRACGACIGSRLHPGKIVAARAFGAGADSVGHTGDCGIEGHRRGLSLLCI